MPKKLKARETKFGASHIKEALTKAKDENKWNRVHVFGHNTPGLKLQTTPPSPRYPNGRQKWLWRFTGLRKGKGKSKVTEMKIGYLPYCTLNEAVTHVKHFMDLRAHQFDPRDAKDRNISETTTFKQCMEMYFAKEKPGRSEAWMVRTERLLNKYAGTLMDKLVHQIKPEDVLNALLPHLQSAPDQMQRARRAIKNVLDFAKAKRFRTQGQDNPAIWDNSLEHLFPSLPKVTDRKQHRKLEYRAASDFLRALRSRQAHSVAAVAAEFMLLTATRTKVVRLMEWREIDWENKVWKIPRPKTKTKRYDHYVPLSEQAIAILLQRKQISYGPYVFSGYSAHKPLSGGAMRDVLYRMGVECSPHGFRTAFKQWSFEATGGRYSRELAEVSLEHAFGNAVEDTYWRGAPALELRRPMMQEWADWCDGKTETPHTAPDLRLIISS